MYAQWQTISWVAISPPRKAVVAIVEDDRVRMTYNV